MPIIRGFVERLEIGRAGLVVASLRHDDGSTNDYQIADLDADPERFNERLSKLGILRDAMTPAEPVEVEYSTARRWRRPEDRRPGRTDHARRPAGQLGHAARAGDGDRHRGGVRATPPAHVPRRPTWRPWRR